MLRKQALFIRLSMLLLLLVLSGCTEAQPDSPQPDAPPLPIVEAESKAIAPVVQSSYCWKNGCADYIGGKRMVEGKPVTEVVPGETIAVRFDYMPQPTSLTVVEFRESETVQISLDKGVFQAPDKRGTYHYGIAADWISKDGKYATGQTTAVFAVKVKGNVTGEEIRNALEAGGIELTLHEQEREWILNGVAPQRYDAAVPGEQSERPEQIAVYIFESEEERTLGLADFNKQKEKYDMAIPLLYELDNAMIFYWHHSSDIGKTIFHAQIKAAVEGLAHKNGGSEQEEALSEQQAENIVKAKYVDKPIHILSVAKLEDRYEVRWEYKQNCEAGTDYVEIRTGKHLGGAHSI